MKPFIFSEKLFVMLNSEICNCQLNLMFFIVKKYFLELKKIVILERVMWVSLHNKGLMACADKT